MSITAHTIGGTKDVPEISFDVVGSTGSVYKTVIGKVPRCNCPDVRFQKAQYKHICFDTSCFVYIPITVCSFYTNVLSSPILNGRLWDTEGPSIIFAIH
ncbi:hypothetical protein N7445_001425 [Penicillium cf. griseofulvum]|nr:hypothetical protein N7445_001425 [Penicillium cf. griseofulvum]